MNINTSYGQNDIRSLYSKIATKKSTDTSSMDETTDTNLEVIGINQNTTVTSDEWNRYLELCNPESEAFKSERATMMSKTVESNEGAPYGYLADENGEINYNGVVYVCDFDNNTISLGDTTDKSKCINVPLSDGGCLYVNRDNLGELASSIGMFSAEDVNRIMRAITQDTRIQQIQKEIDDDKNSIGEGSTNDKITQQLNVNVDIYDTTNSDTDTLLTDKQWVELTRDRDEE